MLRYPIVDVFEVSLCSSGDSNWTFHFASTQAAVIRVKLRCVATDAVESLR
jgi:hypothetical protein